MNKSSFIYGSVFMVFMNFLMRIIGFAYDIILSNLLGAEAMGLFQIAMSTLMTFLIFTISGIPTALTKVIAKENSKPTANNVEGVFKATLLFNLCLSIFLCLILIVFSDTISIKLLKDKKMITGVYFMIPAIIIFSLSNIFKAYFYGMKNMVTPSIAQIIEHGARFIAVIGILLYLKPENPVHGAIIAICGMSVGEFFDLLWSVLSKKRIYKKKSNISVCKPSSFPLLLKILTIAIPTTIAGSFGVIFRFTNTILIPNRLIAAGYSSSESISIFGRVMGMTMPLISLAFIVTSALVLNLIPNLSEQIALKRYRDIKKNIHLSIKATILVAFPLTTIYLVFSEPLAIFLYKDIQVAPFIKAMALATVFMSLQHVISGALLGLNKQVQDTINGIIGMIIRIILIYFLVGDPKFGINGFFIAFYISMVVITILDVLTLRTVVKIKIDFIDTIVKPLLASVFMVGYIYMTTYDIENLQNINPLGLVTSLLVGGLAYIFILILTKAIPKNFFSLLIKSK